MPLTTQGKILRVLTDQSYHRVGGQRPVKVDVRVLSATSRNLADEIAEGRFREDLYLSPQRRAGAHPAAARAARGHSRAGQPFPRPVRRRAADAAADLVRRGDGRAPGARLAGQRPPVAQHHRADDHPRAGRPGRRASRSTCCRPKCSTSQGSGRRDQRDHDDHGQPAARGAGDRSSANICKIQIRRFSGNISRTASFIGMERSALHRKLKALGHRRQARRRRIGSNRAMADKALSLQDHFLNSVRRAKTPVTIFLVKGVKLQGMITWFDAFSLLLRREGASQLVYKHAISTIMPRRVARRTSSRPRRCAGRAGAARALQDLFLAAAARQQEADDRVPGQRRDAAGRGRRLRPILPAARARRAGAAGLQACDLDAAAGASARPRTASRTRRSGD